MNKRSFPGNEHGVLRAKRDNAAPMDGNNECGGTIVHDAEAVECTGTDEGNVIITWPLTGEAHISDDAIERPDTIERSVDPDGRPMTVERHIASNGSPYTIENRVSRDGRPYSVQYPGTWNGKAWTFDPSQIPEWKKEQIGRHFYELFKDFMRELEKDPVRKAEFEAGVEEIRKREKLKKSKKK